MSSLMCKCGTAWRLSEEDPDSTLSDALNHVDLRHPEAGEDNWKWIAEVGK